MVALGAGGRDVAPDDALGLVWGYGVGVDLTRRDLQDEAETQPALGLGQGFDASAPCTPIHPVGEVDHPDSGEIWLRVNGELKQHGDLKDLIWSVPEVISAISAAVDLAPGDLIYSGTPAGVGPMQPRRCGVRWRRRGCGVQLHGRLSRSAARPDPPLAPAKPDTLQVWRSSVRHLRALVALADHGAAPLPPRTVGSLNTSTVGVWPESLRIERRSRMTNHEDRLDIVDVLIRYATGIDRRDWPLFRTVFTDDCVLDYGQIGAWNGVDAVTEFMDRSTRSPGTPCTG